MNTESQSISNQQPLTKCGSITSDLRYSLGWLLAALQSLALKTFSVLKSHLHLHRLACALRETPAILHAQIKILVLTTTINARIYAGLVMMFSALPAWYLFRFFDQKAKIWDFHLNWFFVLMNLGPLLSIVLLLVGLYHILPYKCWQSKIIMWFNGLPIAKMIWNILAGTNDEYNAVPDTIFLVGGVLISIVVHKSIDFFAWRGFHSFHGKTRRIRGIIQAPGIPQDDKDRMILACVDDLENSHLEFKK
jgi:hypothetical protein